MAVPKSVCPERLTPPNPGIFPGSLGPCLLIGVGQETQGQSRPPLVEGGKHRDAGFLRGGTRGRERNA